MLFSPLRSPLAPPLVAVSGVYGRVDAATVTLSVTPSRTSGVAPLAVFFDATDTTSTITTEPWRDVLYAFDYGDSGAGTYTYGAQTGASKNRNVGGPCGGHVYETPGTYTASVWAYDGAGLSRQQFTITVQDPDVVYAGTDTICVSNSGNFAGAPAGASQQAAATWQAAVALLAANKRVLLQREDTWQITASTSIPSLVTDAFLGSFGSGDKATVTKTGSYTVLTLFNSTQRLVLADLHFAGGAFNSPVINGNTATATNTVTLHNISTNLCGSTFVSNGTNRTDNLTFHKVGVTNVAGGAGNVGIYPAATNLLIIDSIIDTAASAEHCIRIPYAGKGFIYGVTAKSPANTKHAITVRAPDWAGGDVTGLPAGSYTEYVVVGNCKFSSNTAQVCTFTPTTTSSDQRLRRCMFEGNHVIAEGAIADQFITMQGYEMTLRNNVIDMTGGDPTTTAITFSNSSVLTFSGNHAYNNTAYRGDACTSITGLNFSASQSGVKLQNMLLYAPGASGTNTVIVAGGTPEVGGNSTLAGSKSTNPLFEGPLTAIEGFRLQSGSPYKNAGVAVPLFVDALAYRRDGTLDAGALNAVDKNTSIWGSVLPD